MSIIKRAKLSGKVVISEMMLECPKCGHKDVSKKIDVKCPLCGTKMVVAFCSAEDTEITKKN
jgi:Zn finger protein HypA/HybF involved in hydrogenase expression